MAESTLAIIILAAAGLIGWRSYDRYRARRLVRLRALADEFYPRAHALLDNPDLVPVLLGFVTHLAYSVATPGSAWGWVRSMRAVRAKPRVESTSNPLTQNGSVGDDVFELMKVGLLLVAELNPIPGVVIRREVQKLGRTNRTEQAKGLAIMGDWLSGEHLEAA